jgi:Tol biopolymer transport system component
MPLLRVGSAATAVLTIVGAAGIVFAGTAEAAWPGGNGKIVFYKFGGSQTAPIAQIYSMNSHGQDQTNLSAAGGGGSQLDIQPNVSPNGKRIAFTRLDPASFSAQIWVMKIDGSHQVDISNDGALASESGPSWTEDGSKILFVRQPPGSFPGDQGGGPATAGGSIWIRSANGKGTPRQLTAGPHDANPAMSPDGDLIAFSRPMGAPGQPMVRHLIVMKADGSDTPNDLGPGSKPDWSPDSKRLVYGQGGAGPIMVVKVSDPSQKKTLTGLFNEAPVWSPDGTKIAYMDCTTSTSAFICQIALMSATGQDQHPITNDQTLSNQKPSWQATARGDERQGGDGNR